MLCWAAELAVDPGSYRAGMGVAVLGVLRRTAPEMSVEAQAVEAVADVVRHAVEPGVQSATTATGRVGGGDDESA